VVQVCNSVCHKFIISTTAVRMQGLSVYQVGIYHCKTCTCDITVAGVEFKKGSITCKCCHNKVRMSPRHVRKEVVKLAQ